MKNKVLSLSFAGVIFASCVFNVDVKPAAAALGEQPKVYHSEENPGKSEITIYTNNTEQKPVKATGYLSKHYIGYAHKSWNGKWQFYLDGYGPSEGKYNTVHNKQVVRVYVSEGEEQGAFDVKVKTIESKVVSKKKLEKTPPLKKSMVKIKNNKRKADTITVKGLPKKSKVTVYNSKNKKIAQKTAKGSTLKISIKQLGKKSGYVKITLQKKGKSVSKKTKFKYSHE
ncbi:hypothetical protein [Bacillus sp. CX-1]|uniref:hypothetical protein n=1 Tax=Bacillus sp. CX-1 TaxID=2045018 RepID=UPI000BF60163|nr:hypothetical protein [Bacillus sp. CX-1]